MIKIYKDGTLSTEEIMSRDGEGFDASAIVREIIANVRKNGDAALMEYCEKFDGGAPESLLVSAEEIARPLHFGIHGNRGKAGKVYLVKGPLVQTDIAVSLIGELGLEYVLFPAENISILASGKL